MKIAAIGIGGAGGRLVDELASQHGVGRHSPLQSVHAVDTDQNALSTLGQIAAEMRHTIGQFETGGDGLDGDRQRGTEIAADEGVELRRSVEDGITTTIDAIVLFAGLGGGTGSAITPQLAAGLETVYELPIYTVSILPAEYEYGTVSGAERGGQDTVDDETQAKNSADPDDSTPGDESDSEPPADADGQQTAGNGDSAGTIEDDEWGETLEQSNEDENNAALSNDDENDGSEHPTDTTEEKEAQQSDSHIRRNAAEALAELQEIVETQIVFDNESWLWGDRTLESHGDLINRAFIDRFSELITAGQTSAGDAVGERFVDTSDIMETLNGGGMTTLGYASSPLSIWRGSSIPVLGGIRRRLLGDDTETHVKATAIQRTLTWATRGTLTFDCPRESAARGLVIFSGPPDWLRRDAIASGRDWLETRTGTPELRSGDTPTPGASSLQVFLVLSGISDTPRIQALDTEK